ncbi:fluoroacetate dehalogenase [Malaciobacter pacificus]|uniref:Alpha/beta hydrolase family protein n=1 Tax=Malaciobacter pacificus TaxID=1080223 RepID=A0A5C2HEA3_9BACT|nr:alpha/beta hydrolase [Malaciobacter pacificus]QEP34702.1 alpha/beta hydrolase family protein [Malaciobacter pacificus]GGD48942.1 fluoroacetate dehalogenase [Malaciobacter pacificus]
MLFNKNFKKDRFITSDNIQINYVSGGRGEPLLLLHGYPQTHVMWASVANELSNDYFVICPDLRGYGDSSKPKGLENHENYSKKVMANDMIELMEELGYEEFYLAGHDRGARVTHRICLDYPHMIKKVSVLDIAPTFHMFLNSDMNFSTGYYHWFFLIQEYPLPETLIGNNAEYYLKEKLKRWSAPGATFNEDAVKQYVRCFDKDMIHSTCEDYRASATVDMNDDAFSRDKKISMPLLVLWGEKGFINKNYNVIDVWKDYAKDVSGKALECGHFLAEEAPFDVIDEFRKFFR